MQQDSEKKKISSRMLLSRDIRSILIDSCCAPPVCSFARLLDMAFKAQVFGFRHTMPLRAASVVSVDETQALLRQNCASLGDQYKSADYAMVCSGYESFLVALLAKTPRVNKKVLEQAALKTYDGLSQQEAALFSRQICSALTSCREKKKSVTSGSKTHPSVKRIIAAMQTAEEQESRTPATPAPVQKGNGALPLAKSSSSSQLQDADPWELYGVSPPAKRKSSSRRVVAVSSSSEEQEAEPCPAEGARASKKAALPEPTVKLQWFDQQRGVMKKTLDNGLTLEAACHHGSNGFLVYEYAGEGQCESEIPNLALEAVSKVAGLLKRPAAAKAVQKRPAAATGSSTASATADGECSERVVHSVRLTKAANPERTYITACQCDGSSKHRMQLIVEYSLNRDGPNHLAKAQAAKEYIIQNGLTYSSARRIRELLPQ